MAGTTSSIHLDPADTRLSLSALCFPRLSLAAFVDEASRLGVRTVGLDSRRIIDAGPARAADLLASASLDVSAIVDSHRIPLDAPEQWPAIRAGIEATIDAAARLGAGTVYMITGPRTPAHWDDAMPTFAAAIAPSVAYGRDRHVRLAVEPTIPLYADLSFVHTLDDATALAELAGTAICLDLFHCWTEFDLAAKLRRAGPHLAHVQLSDYVGGDRSLPARAVPGDGIVPLDRLLHQLLAAGYDGAFDLELSGPRIDAEGHREAAGRAVNWLAAALTP